MKGSTKRRIPFSLLTPHSSFLLTLLCACLLGVVTLSAQTQLGADIAGEGSNEVSGYSVSLSPDGSTVAIGAIGNDDNGFAAGHVQVYKLISGVWTQQGGDINGEAANDNSGYWVSLSSDGSTVAIGAQFNDGNGANSGHVRVYKIISGVWTQQGADINGEAGADESGTSVSLSSDGSTVAIGAPYNDGNGSNSGHVRVYKLTSGTWTQQGADINGEATADESGTSVSLSSDGNTVAIGAPNNDGSGSNSGHVRVYKLISGAWMQQGGDINGEAADDASGYSVSLSPDGGTVAIGAPHNDGNGLSSGHARVYKLLSGAWTQQGADINGEAADDLSGYTVSLSSDGSTVAIGAPYNDGNGTSAGHVRAYNLISGVWTQQGTDIDSEETGDLSGFSVSLSSDGGTVAIGAPYNDNYGANAGHVRVYALPLPPDINAFIITVKTDNPGTSNSTSFTIPTAGSGYNYEVDWNNDGAYDQTGITGSVTHNYGTTGTYTLRIRGTFPRIYFNNGGDRQKLLDISQWGSIAWTSMSSAFYGCSNLNISATDVPNLSGVTSLILMFQGCTILNGPANIGTWNTAAVTDMRFMFNGASAFNQPIGTWNTAAVTDMGYMFKGASAFNQPIGTWNTAAVTDMRYMFFLASAFNQPIGTWNTAAVTDMSFMFVGASAFNQPIGTWNTAAVTNMNSMFYQASAFDQPIGTWNTAAVTNMNFMFFQASAFDQPIGTWSLNASVNLTSMLSLCGMSCLNYSATLIGWANNPATPSSRYLGASGRQYGTNAAAARTTLTTAKGWGIPDDAASGYACEPCPANGTIWYVDASAASGGTGTSWACAFQNVQDAINAASSGHEVWVKAGTYKPTKDPFGNASPADPRDKTFYLKDGVAVYGGFDGTETLRTQRNYTSNVTKLSGDIGTANDNSDNCYHVFLSLNNANTTVLDGFTIEKGRAFGTGSITVSSISIPRAAGGGMKGTNSAMLISNCKFVDNAAGVTFSGGGACEFSNNGGTATFTNCQFLNNTTTGSGGAVVINACSPTFTDCLFSANTSVVGGGGIYIANTGANPVFTRCIFRGNETTSLYGGGIQNNNGSPVLTNCLFSGNKAVLGGGMLNNQVSANAQLVNCTFSGNHATTNGGGFHNINGAATMTNCLIWNNRAGSTTGSAGASLSVTNGTVNFTYSLVQNWSPAGTGNLDGIPNAAESNYPAFVTLLDPATAPSTAGNFQITSCSPVLNLGTNTGAPTTDLFGNTRPYATTVDMGVHELQSGSARPTTANAGADQTGSATCGLTTVTLAANTPSVGTGLWTKITGTGGSFGNASSPTSTFTGNAGGTYELRWTISNSPCNATSDDMIVIFNPNPTTANAGPDQTGSATCGLTQVTLAANTPSAGSGTWFITNGSGGSFSSSNSPNATFYGTAGTAYTLQWRIGTTFCGNSTDDVNVTFNQNPAMSCPANMTVEDNDPAFTLSGATPTGGTYSGAGVSGGMFNPAVAGLGTHTITYAYTSAAGCSGSCTFTITVVSGCPAAGTIWYVDGSAASGGTGTSWACAFQNVQDAINAASSGHEIWVKAGTYKPTKDPFGNASPTDPRDKTFYLKDGVAVYGGFDGTETARSQRNWTSNLTILSGDIGTVGNNSDNCYHVVLSVSDASTTVLDGFTIQKGNANGGTGNIVVETKGTYRYLGGGLTNIFSSITVENCIFDTNSGIYGGGMYNEAGAPVVTTCTFSNNSAIQANGGGMLSSGSAAIVTNCTFSNNLASSGQGGGMSIDLSSTMTVTNCVFSANSAGNGGGMQIAGSSAPTLTNCLFSGNSASNTNGGGLLNVGSGQAVLINCTFSGNKATGGGGGICNSSSNPILTNCLIWNNRAASTTGSASASLLNFSSTPIITYSLIQSHNPAGTGNLNGITQATLSNYPDFVSPLDPATAPSTSGDFHIGACSPAINTGTNSGAPATDLFGNARPFGANVDMGVHEFQGTPTPAVATCQAATVQLDGAGNGTLTASALNNGSTGCAPLAFSASQTSFNCSNLGPNTVTLTVTALNGATSTCNATVTVADQVAPNALCRDFVKNLDANGTATITAAEVNNLSNDNCGTVNLVGVSPNSFTCSDLGAKTVTLSINDGHGNTASCNATVTVADNAPPTAICQNVAVNLTGNSATVTAAQVNNGSSDNCGTTNLSLSTTAFTCASVGTNTVVLTVNDGHSNAATCSATVTVSDATNPTALCKNVSVSLNGSGTATVTAAQVNNGSSDACGIASLALSQTTFDCSDVGANTVTLTVTDNNNRTATCSATVTVSDASDPNAVCQNATVNLDQNGNATLAATQVDGGSTDNCGIATRSVTPNTFTTAHIGANTVTLTVTDNNNRTATCTATVTVTNTNLPNAVCQPHTAVIGSNGTATINAADVDGGSSAVGGIQSMNVSPNSFTCSDLGTNTVTLTVTGNNNLTATCNAVVTVQDNTPPTPVCQNLSVNLSGNTATITASQILNAAASSDNCGTVNAQSVSLSTFTCSNLGANTVTLTVNDGHGNTATCTAIVTVSDATPPTAICQNIPVSLNGSGTAGISAAQVNNSSTDNCGAVNLVGVSPSSFTCADIGANTVTLTVNDGHGNAATCTAIVTVSDAMPPTALCRDVVVQLDGNGNALLTAAQVNNGSTDNCALGPLSVAPNAFTLADLGLNTVTLTVPDANGNSSTCSAQVTVENNQLPNAVCRNIIRDLNSSGTVAITPDDVDDGSTALGGIASRNVSPNTLTCANIGAATVTLTIVGNNNQQASCNATVTVSDATPPTAVCQNATVNLSGNSASVTAAQINNGSSDNCGTVNLVGVSPSSFTCADIGANTVTLTINDGHGNTATCTAIVTVSDATLPTAVCKNATVNLSGNSASITAAQINNGSSDNCGTVNLVGVSPNSFTCADIGANTVTLTVNDGHGNTGTCNAIVTVSDVTLPTAVCKNATVNLNGNSATVTAAQVNNGSTDNCGTVNLVGVSPGSFTCADIGANTVTLTVNDGHGNSVTCSATVTVTDNTAPTAICQNATVNLSGNSASVTAAQINNGSTDNCGTVNLVGVSPSSFTCADIGANTVTLTINDGHGNSATCSATVTVSDATLPTAVCKNATVTLSGNSASVTAAQVNNGSTDNCGTVNLVGVSPNSFTCADIGANTVTLTVNDGHGNSASCTAIVTVSDATPPTAVCQNATVNLSGNSASVTAAQINNGSTDNCGTVNLVGVSPNSFTCADIGANTVTLTVNDGHGNTASCSATVTVTDNTAPTAICQNATVSLNGNSASITAAQINNGSTDNCGTVNLVGVSPSSFTCADIGANTVTLTVNDGHGNSATCSATVTVSDATLPTAVCKNATVNLSGNSASIAAAQVNNGSTDNCGTVNLVGVSPSSFTCADIGVNTVTLTVNDGHGNTATCTAIVTVSDATLPTAVCQNATVNLNGNSATVTATQINNGSSDNCGTVNLVGVSPNSFTCADIGANTVTLTINDGHGNSATCSATVTVSDATLPTAVCKNATVNLSGNSASVTAAQINNGSTDNCGTVNLVGVSPNSFTCADIGANTVTLTVNDGHGKTATCNASVTVVDNTPPTAVCQNATVEIQANEQGTIAASAINNGSSDNCGIQNLTLNRTTFDCADLGTVTVTLTATDVNGLSSACTATVTVTDPNSYCCAAPSALCKTATVVLNAAGQATIAVADVNNGSTHECGLQGMAVSPTSVNCANIGAVTVTLTVTDVNNASSQCTAVVAVQDNSLPTIACPSATTVTCSSGVPTVNLTAVTASDNCGSPTKSHVGDATSNQTCTNRKTVTRTYRATDASGNSATCSQVITVFDNVLPVFTFVPANVTVQCNSIPAVGTATATDGCGGTVTVVYNGQTTESGACTDAYTITRQWTATDACGNTKTATQRINVIDTQKPNFTTTPANVTVQCSAVPAPASPTATDNCDAAVAVTYNGQTQTNGACPNAYTLTRTWTAADNCGNTKTVTQRIVVVDNGKPVFTAFPANTSMSCYEAPPAVGSPTASDGCGTATVTYLGQTTVSGNCPGNYQIRRTWRATDACGNSTASTQTIQVSDTGAPVFTSTPGPLTIECGDPLPPLVNPTASDACGGYVQITFLGNVPSGSGCAADYTVTRTWRAEDLCGNSATTSQVITVLGNNNAEEEGAENRDAIRLTTASRLPNMILQPNPTTDRVWLDLTDFAGEAVTVSIFDDLGRLVWERRIPAVEEQKLSVSLLETGAKAGIYTVSVRSGSSAVAKRVVLVE